MALQTLPKSAPRVDGAALATCWLAAGTAGVKTTGDDRLDRALTIERHTVDGRPAGFVFAGVSPDLVVVAGLPIYQGPVGPQGLWDLLIEGEPADRWQVDDRSLGAVTMRQVITRTKEVGKKGGKVWCTLSSETRVPEGTLGETGATSYVHIAVDGLTEGTLVPQATYTPVNWREAMPTGDAITPHTPLMRESSSVFARLNRLSALLPVTELGWEFHQLPSGKYVRYLKVMTDDLFIEVSAGVRLDPNGSPTIWDIAHQAGPTVGEQGEIADDDWETPGPPIDPDAQNVIAAAFGAQR